MNNSNRLYRNTQNATLGGVASGLADYFKVDPTLVRLGFIVATIVSSGAFLVLYLIMWLVIPAAGSTTTGTNDIIQENINEIGARIRSFAGGTNAASSNPNGPAGSNAVTNTSYNETQSASTGTANQATQARANMAPMLLIIIGGIFLMANLGIFQAIRWHVWWPLFLIALGVILLSRRR